MSRLEAQIGQIREKEKLHLGRESELRSQIEEARQKQLQTLEKLKTQEADLARLDTMAKRIQSLEAEVIIRKLFF